MFAEVLQRHRFARFQNLGRNVTFWEWIGEHLQLHRLQVRYPDFHDSSVSVDR
ncbi:MAG TPA: hypothetical protein EYM27_08625 [Dehalococcoidia bacterium]|nr:hypothetical protein [Dehalococcoidia bacterium]